MECVACNGDRLRRQPAQWTKCAASCTAVIGCVGLRVSGDDQAVHVVQDGWCVDGGVVSCLHDLRGDTCQAVQHTDSSDASNIDPQQSSYVRLPDATQVYWFCTLSVH